MNTNKQIIIALALITSTASTVCMQQPQPTSKQQLRRYNASSPFSPAEQEKIKEQARAHAQAQQNELARKKRQAKLDAEIKQKLQDELASRAAKEQAQAKQKSWIPFAPITKTPDTEEEVTGTPFPDFSDDNDGDEILALSPAPAIKDVDMLTLIQDIAKHNINGPDATYSDVFKQGNTNIHYRCEVSQTENARTVLAAYPDRLFLDLRVICRLPVHGRDLVNEYSLKLKPNFVIDKKTKKAVVQGNCIYEQPETGFSKSIKPSGFEQWLKKKHSEQSSS